MIAAPVNTLIIEPLATDPSWLHIRWYPTNTTSDTFKIEWFAGSDYGTHYINSNVNYFLLYNITSITPGEEYNITITGYKGTSIAAAGTTNIKTGE